MNLRLLKRKLRKSKQNMIKSLVERDEVDYEYWRSQMIFTAKQIIINKKYGLYQV